MTISEANEILAHDPEYTEWLDMQATQQNKAFLFAECGDEVLANIDIGIGSIPYAEPYVWGCIVIATTLQSAWDMLHFEGIDTLEEWLTPKPSYAFGHIESCNRIAICIHETIQEPIQVIGSHEMNPHWLCHYVQFNKKIDRAFRYQPSAYGDGWGIWWDAKASYSSWRKPILSWVDMQGQYQSELATHTDDSWNEVPF